MSRLGLPASWMRQIRRQGGELLKDLHYLWRGALVVLSLGFFLYLGTFLMLVFSQEEVIFRPIPGFSEKLPIHGMVPKPMSMEWEEGEAKAMYWERAGSPGVLVFFYGNATNIERMYERVKWLASHTKLSIFMADFPGYGVTSGRPTQRGIQELMGLWLDKLESDEGMDREKRILWGHSLGGAVAAQMAKSHGAAGLILENTFNNMEDMGGLIYPWMPIGWVLRHPFASDEALVDWKGVILQFHSPADGVVPFLLGQRLSEALRENPRYLWVETGGTHNGGYLEFSQTIWEGVTQFAKLLDSPLLGEELSGARSSFPRASSLPNPPTP